MKYEQMKLFSFMSLHYYPRENGRWVTYIRWMFWNKQQTPEEDATL